MTFRSIALSLSLAGFALAQSPATLPGSHIAAAQRRALEAYGPDVEIRFNAREVPSSIMGRLSARSHNGDPAAEAQAALDLHGAAFRRGPDDGFAFAGLTIDKAGVLNVRMAQTYKGLPVVDGELTVHLDDDSVLGISGRFMPDLAVDTDAARFGAAVGVEKDGTGRLVTFASEDSVSVTTPRAAAPANLLLNPGFESGSAPWNGQNYVKVGGTLGWLYRQEPPICTGATVTAARTGSRWACMGGNGTTNTEVLDQVVTVPALAQSGTLSFWLRITTRENPEIYPYLHDTLSIQIRDDVSNTTATMAVFSNLNEYNYRTYRQVTLPFPSGYRGKKVHVRFVSAEDGSVPTWFDIDDSALTFTSF